MKLRHVAFAPGRPGPLRDLGLLALRIGCAATLALAHGWGKLQDLFQGSARFPDPLGIGSLASLGLVTFAEFVCALALVVGFMSRLACVPLVINFAVAFFVHHGADPLDERELALLFLVVFTGLLLTGPGRFSLDQWFRRR